LAAFTLLGGMLVPVGSLTGPSWVEHLDETIDMAANFWQNLQFDLVLAAALVVVLWALIRPRDLGGGRIYRWAGLCLLLLALSPLLVFTDTPVRPLAKSQYVARSGAGLVVAAIVIFLLAWASPPGERLPALVLPPPHPRAAPPLTPP